MEVGAMEARALGHSLPSGCKGVGVGAADTGRLSPGRAADPLLVLTLSEVSPPRGFPSFPPTPNSTPTASEGMGI